MKITMVQPDDNTELAESNPWGDLGSPSFRPIRKKRSWSDRAIIASAYALFITGCMICASGPFLASGDVVDDELVDGWILKLMFGTGVGVCGLGFMLYDRRGFFAFLRKNRRFADSDKIAITEAFRDLGETIGDSVAEAMSKPIK